ncbi:MAG: Bcr/CflA family efflux MFS transporter [Pseudomonadota bacterium]
MHLPFLLLFSMAVLPLLSENIYAPALPALAAYFKAPVTLVEATLSIYFAGFALGIFMWGCMADRIGRRFSMIAGWVVYIFATWICSISTDISVFFLARFVQAFGASVGSVIGQTMTRDVYHGKERSVVFTKIGIYLALAPALGPLVGGTLSTYFGWQSNFYFLLVLSFSLLIYMVWKLPETKPLNMPIPRPFWLMNKMIRDPFIWVSSLIVATSNGLAFSFYAEGPFIWENYFHYGMQSYGYLGLLFAGSAILGGIIGHRLLKHFTAEAMNLIAAALLLISGFIAYTLMLFSYDIVAQTFILICLVMMLFVTFNIGVPSTLATALQRYQEYSGTAASIFGCMYYIIVAIFTYGISWFHNGSPVVYPLYFTGIAALLFIVLVGQYGMTRRRIA